MALTKTDLQDITQIVQTSLVKERVHTEQLVRRVVNEEIGKLELTLNDCFDEVQSSFAEVNQRFESVDLQLSEMRKDIVDIRFKVSETVHRSEFLDLSQRVEKLEQQAFKA